MSFDLLYKKIVTDPNVVKSYIVKSFDTLVTVIEYRDLYFPTGEHLKLFLIPKEKVDEVLQAFITLLNYKLHLEEEWPLEKNSPEDASNILDKWISPLVKKDCFMEVSEKTIRKEVNSNSQNLMEHIREIEERYGDNDNDFGVFLNGVKLSSQLSLAQFDIGKILFGSYLFKSYSETIVFYQTSKNYVLSSYSI